MNWLPYFVTRPSAREGVCPRPALGGGASTCEASRHMSRTRGWKQPVDACSPTLPAQPLELREEMEVVRSHSVRKSRGF